MPQPDSHCWRAAVSFCRDFHNLQLLEPSCRLWCHLWRVWTVPIYTGVYHLKKTRNYMGPNTNPWGTLMGYNIEWLGKVRNCHIHLVPPLHTHTSGALVNEDQAGAVFRMSKIDGNQAESLSRVPVLLDCWAIPVAQYVDMRTPYVFSGVTLSFLCLFYIRPVYFCYPLSSSFGSSKLMMPSVYCLYPVHISAWHWQHSFINLRRLSLLRDFSPVLQAHYIDWSMSE